MYQSNQVYSVILAGGSGTRLWPLSRELVPKQLINLSGEESLLSQTIDRAYLLSKQAPIIVTGQKIYNQIDQHKITKNVEFLIEPKAKNTAPAIALAAKRALEFDPEAILVILSADHYIDDKTFVPFVKNAIEATEKTKSIVLIGIKPIRPETGYGYIKIGEKIGNNIHRIKSFEEKPEKRVAETYLKDKKYLWNAGIFIAKAKVLKTEIEKHLPSLKELFKGGDIEKIFQKLEPISIDNGVLEKTSNITVVPTKTNWNDLGSWGSVYDICKHDRCQNYLEGNIICEKTEGSLVMARGNRRIATIGLQNVVIVDTEDVTLICDRDRTQDVKNLVEKIKLDPNNKDHIEHKTMHRPWGRYTVLDEGDGFKVKFIHVEPGGKLSLQSHNHRSEHWVVVKGIADITIGGEVKRLNPNESIYVPLETKHRLANPGNDELTIVEVATGSYIEEDDIKRYDDAYSRN